jgi:hypothetical protein
MEGMSEVPGKRRKTSPPRGAVRRSIHSRVHSHPCGGNLIMSELFEENG